MVVARRRSVRLPAAIALAACILAGCAAWPGPDAALRNRGANGPLAFAAAPSGRPADVYSVAAGGGTLHLITRGGPPVSEAAWSADGSEVVFARRTDHTTAGGEWAGHIDVYVLRAGGTPKLIRRCPLACAARSFAWSPDGRRIAFVTDIRSRFTGAAGEIAVMNADGGRFHAVCTESVCGQGLEDPRWSPDGSRLLFSDMGVIGFPSLGILPSRIWVAGSDGADPHPLTQPRCRPGHPPLRGCAYDSAAAWSPDGRWIAFSRLHQGIPPRPGPPRTSIELMRPDGSDLHAIATCTGILCNQQMPPAWSPGSDRIAYAPRAERGSRIVLVTPSGARTSLRTCAGRRCAVPFGLAWSPDGRSLGFSSGAGVESAFVIGRDGRGMHLVGRDVQCCVAWLPAL